MSFPRYPEYKDSGVKWLGEVPAHWDLVPLKQVISRIESGTSVNAIDTPAGDGELGVLKTSCVYYGYFDADENKAVIPDEYDRVACPVKAGTLVVSRMNTPDLVGAAGVVRTTHENLFLPDRLWQVHFDSADANFVHHWTHTLIYRAQVEMACAGASSSMQNLGQDQFRCFVIPRPSVDEQTAIATFLDHETAKIDALVAEQQKLIALLQEKRQAVISHAVTKGLNPNAPMKDSGVEWLGEVPRHWEVLALKRLIEVGSTISYGIVQPGEPQDEGVPFIQTTNMSSGRFDLLELQKTTEAIARQYPRSRLSGGEVILGIRASIGAAFVVTEELAGVNLSRGVARIQCASCLVAAYLVQFLMGHAVETYWQLSKQGSTFNEVSIETVRELVVAVPPIEEQETISAYLMCEVVKFDELVSEARTAITLLQERRTALISAAVTGQIDVRGWTQAGDASDFIAASAGAEGAEG